MTPSGTALMLLAGDATADAAVRAVGGHLAAAGWAVRETPSVGPADVVVTADPAAPAAAGVTGARVCAVLTATAPEVFADPAVAIPLAEVAAATRGLVVCRDRAAQAVVEAYVPQVAGRAVVTGDEALLRRLAPAAVHGLARGGRPLRVVVAGHALHFVQALISELEASPEVELRVDHVPSFAHQDQARSRELVEWADVVFCEWCSPVAVWYSHNKRQGQRLIVRLHRYEVTKEWPKQLDIDAVDQVACVSPLYAGRTREMFGWPESKVTVVPNSVDAAAFDRPKHPGARFCLGAVGMMPSLKRVDLAFDVLARLRRRDPRYRMAVKTKMAWDDRWNRSSPEQMEYGRTMLRRAAGDPELSGAVSFEPYGPDVPNFLRGVGFVLSTSDGESFHLAPAEGMASGAVPCLLSWPGAETIYDRRWIHDDPAAMADWIDDVNRSGAWPALGAAAKEQLRRSFDTPLVVARFCRLLQEDLPLEADGQSMSAPVPLLDEAWPRLLSRG